MLWQQTAEGKAPRDYGDHFSRASAAVGLVVPRDGWFLDAGSGDGTDASAVSTRFPGLRVVGLDLTEAGQRAQASTGLNAYFVQGDVVRPPFHDRRFALVYCYGVLHHTPDPATAFKALAALVCPGGKMLIYVYSDLREQPVMRLAVALTRLIRRLTTRMAPEWIFLLSRLGSPAVYLLFVVPRFVLLRVPATRRMAERLPFNWVRTPMGAVGDLYDRFSAPIEHRHSADEVRGWFASAGLAEVRVGRMSNARGWVAIGTRPTAPET